MGGGNSKYEDDAKRHREENERLQAIIQSLRDEQQSLKDEQQRLINEKHDLELKSTQAEKAERESELRRVTEKLKQIEESRQIMEDLRRTQEEKRILEEKFKMDIFARQLEEDARTRVEREVWLRLEAERHLEQGIPPVKYPTGDEIAERRAGLGYKEGFLHIAITGCSGSGKSTLINAVRGLSDPITSFPGLDFDFTSLSSYKDLKDTVIDTLSQNLAQTGVNETTTAIQRYADPNDDRRDLAWYDVPGAGTINVPSWQYFNNQGLYIFDIIMIAVGDRITSTDRDLLLNCRRFGIPTFFVRSKADQHIKNITPDNATKEHKAAIRTGYIGQTRTVFNSILVDAGLPPQKIYIVSRIPLRLLNNGQSPKPKSIIDEEELIRDIANTLRKWSTPDPAEK
ncbi:hypothetical protein DFP73DRAFT_546529 [Morchella snyderi]|nr:hypothetical protein DFP73DRAFT_546529 [Morchella snyderi]